MSATISCPKRDVLHRLMIGQCAESDSEQLAKHLEQCPSCSAAVATLRTKDTLVDAVRAPSTVFDGPEGEVVRRLVERLRESGPPVKAAETQQVWSTLPQPASVQPVYSFLATPQGPEEIGRLGPYRIVKVLGAGGMGVVFQAEDVALRRWVALKVMKPEIANQPTARERFLREARSAATLEHEHVVTIYQVGEEHGVPFLAMQWLRGMSLSQRLGQSRSLSVGAILRLGRQVALGLAAAHEQGLIHRDIKPDNLWLEELKAKPGTSSPGYRVKILDFGLARPLHSEPLLTRSGDILGTPAYMSPEQARGQAVDHRCDLFSLGCVLYRLCTGSLPFPGDNALAVLTALVTDTPRPVRDINPTVPVPLAQLVTRLLAKDPADRPASARVVADELQAMERQRAAPVPPAAVPSVSVPKAAMAPVRGQTRRNLSVGVAIALLAMVPLGYFFGGQIIRVATNQGQVVIEIDDPGMEVSVKEGAVAIRDRTGQKEITLAAGAHELEVTVKDPTGTFRSFTSRFSLSRGGKEVINVQYELARAALPVAPPAANPPAPAPIPGVGGAERRAAEWVLANGGTVGIEAAGGPKTIRAAKDLPAENLRVVEVVCEINPRLTDADLERLQGLPHLTTLAVNNTPVGDAGLAHLRPLARLTKLDLGNTRVTDLGLAHLKALTNLTYLGLVATRVTDAGMVHLQTLSNLSTLSLYETKVTDAGLGQLKSLANLTFLNLRSTRVTDAGLVHLAAFPNLSSLELWGTRVSDAGLVHLRPLRNLKFLSLHGTAVSDAGLERLHALTNLQYLGLASTRVSDRGLPHLKALASLNKLILDNTPVTDDGLEHLKALPGLAAVSLNQTRVTDAGLARLWALPRLSSLSLSGTRVSDDGLPHFTGMPRLHFVDLTDTRLSATGFATLKAAFPNTRFDWSEPNRAAAEAVLALGGVITIRPKDGGDERGLRDVTDLPAALFQVTRVSLANVAQPIEGLIKKLGALADPVYDRLEALDLVSQPVTDADIALLKPLTKLADLSLAGTKVGDAGLVHLKDLTSLRRLVLDGTPIRGLGLSHLQDLPQLTELRLGCPARTDLFITPLGACEKLERLSLAGSAITGAGLKPLHRLAGLVELDLTGTKVTAEDVAALRVALPKCRIQIAP